MHHSNIIKMPTKINMGKTSKKCIFVSIVSINQSMTFKNFLVSIVTGKIKLLWAEYTDLRMGRFDTARFIFQLEGCVTQFEGQCLTFDPEHQKCKNFFV